MSDGALRISILGDASQFTKTLAKLQAELEDFQQKLKNATGADIPKLNLQILGAETSIKQITEFGKFAEGSLGFYKQLKRELEGRLDVTTNKAEQEQLVKRLSDVSNIIKDIKSAGIEKPIPIPIVIEPPPPGSIASLRETIKNLTSQRDIQVDRSAFEQYNTLIQQLENKIKELKSIGIEIPVKPITPVLENSIAGLQEKVNKLRNTQINIDVLNAEEIARTNDEIIKLETEIQRLKGLSIDPNGKLTQSSAKARQAITSLSLVAQDAAFGFIAIQNNLPAVLQTFTELDSKNNGLTGSLKELGSALVGPAGVFLAFSVVTGAITYAVKEYGSLGNAVDALFGKLSKFNNLYMRTAKGLKEYNENLLTNDEITGKAVGSQQGLISKISALSEVVLDVTQSEDDRKKALQGLQEIDKERFKNFDIETGKYKEIEGAVNSLTKSILAKAQADAFAQQFSLASVQFEQQKTATDAALKDLQEFEKKSPGARKELEKYIKLNKDAFEPSAPNSRVAQLQDLELKLLTQQNTLKLTADEYIRLNNLAKLYSKTANSLSTLKPPDDGSKNVFAPQIDSQELDEAFNLDRIITNLTSYGNVLIDVNKSEEERKNALRELKEINSEYFQSFTTQKSLVGQYKIKLEDLIRTFKVEKKEREDLLRISKLNEDFRKNEEKGIKSLGDKYNIFADQKSSFPETFEDIQKAYEGNTKQGESLFKNLISDKADVKRATEPLAELQRQFQLAYTAINQTFFEPLQNLFETFLNTGKFTFKEFTKSVLKSITSIVSKLAATGVITGLMYLLDPSGMLASFGGGFGGQGGGNGILSALGSVFGAQPRKPDFNGVRPQGGGRGGEKVEFQIRGTNLVGVLNRANGEINRIG